MIEKQTNEYIDNIDKDKKIRNRPYWYGYFLNELQTNINQNVENSKAQENEILLKNNIITISKDNYYSKLITQLENKNYTIRNEEVMLYLNKCIYVKTNTNCNINNINCNVEIMIYEKEAVDTYFRENFDGKIENMIDFFEDNYIGNEDEFTLSFLKRNYNNIVMHEIKTNNDKKRYIEEVEDGYFNLSKMAREEAYEIIYERITGISLKRKNR